jgi:hypothetical protein
MDVDQLAEALATHRADNERQFAEIHKGLKMSEPTSVKNIFETSPMAGVLPYMAGGNWGGAGAGAGAGLGAGLLGGVLGGALLGGNGLFGNRNLHGEGVVTPAQLTAALNGVTESNNTTQILQTLGDIKAAVPLAEAQVQLALAGAQNDITTALNASQNALATGQGEIRKEISDNAAAVLASQNSINVNVLQSAAATREAITTYGNANLLATKEAATAAALAVANSTKEIIAALNDQNTANLQRQLTVAEQALFEQRAESRARGTEVNVTQTVNQNQLQLQAQQQQQQQSILLAQLLTTVSGLQNAVATNSNLIVGNTGAVATGAQTANPVNVRA